MGFDVFNLTMRRFGWEWRAGRRIADHSLRPAATLTYRPILVSMNHQFIQQLLRTPNNFVEHLRQYVLRYSFVPLVLRLSHVCCGRITFTVLQPP